MAKWKETECRPPIGKFVIADFHEADGQDVLKETLDEFQGIEDQPLIKSRGDTQWPKIRESDFE